MVGWSNYSYNVDDSDDADGASPTVSIVSDDNDDDVDEAGIVAAGTRKMVCLATTAGERYKNNISNYRKPLSNTLKFSGSCWMYCIQLFCTSSIKSKARRYKQSLCMEYIQTTSICKKIYKYTPEDIRYYTQKASRNPRYTTNWAHELGKWQRLSSLTNNVIDINAICQTCIVSQFLYYPLFMKWSISVTCVLLRLWHLQVNFEGQKSSI